jgi:amino acid transporter
MHPNPTEAGGRKLSLADAVAKAIGATIGGGVFAIIGEAVLTSGNAAFISLGLAGLLTLITAVSYSRLAIRYDQPSSTFLFAESLSGPRLAGTLSWLVLLGYTLAMSLYAYVFGQYVARLLGLSESLTPFLGAGAIAFALVANLLHLRRSAVTEDILVYGRIALLLTIIAAGLPSLRRAEITPILEGPPFDVTMAAGLIFVAYEGFQMLVHDYEDIAGRGRTLHRALWIAVPAVTLLYMGIAFITSGSLGHQVVVQHKATVLADVVRPILGRPGFLVVLISAIISTASAADLALFSTGRLANRIGPHIQLPQSLLRPKGRGVSVTFLLLVAALALAIQAVGNLRQISLAASLVFLLVFAAINLFAALARQYHPSLRWLPIIGCLGCLALATQVTIMALNREPITLWILLAGLGLLLLLRLLFTHRNPNLLHHEDPPQ